MNKNRIEKGDIVKVYFYGNMIPGLASVMVDYVPQSVTDHWIFIESGKPVYVDTYSRIDLLWKHDQKKASVPIK